MTNTQTTTETPSTAPQQSPGLMGSLAPITLMVLVFYFLIIRPQQKRESKRRNLVASVKKGDRLLTASGIIGVLHKTVGEKEISLEVAENVRIRMLKNSITDVLEKDSSTEESESENETKKPVRKISPPSGRNKPLEKNKNVKK
ncbi:MAG: preprotein translocase subunit YajC [Holosporaceae bacterium]|jgi:preprotein translocase subunit YajC|nr:preprotein translocase subunit YajC [Holosporaceae bacterium]